MQGHGLQQRYWGMAVDSGTGSFDLRWMSYRVWAAVCGGLLCVPPVVSLIERSLHVALAPPLQGALALYRRLYAGLFDWVAGYVLALFPFIDLDRLLYRTLFERGTYLDLTLLGVLSSIALLRALLLVRAQALEVERLAHLESTRRVLAAEVRTLEITAKQRDDNLRAVPLSEIDRRQALEEEFDTAHHALRRGQQKIRTLDREERDIRAWQRAGGVAWEPLLEGYALLAVFAIVCGFTLAGLALPLLTTIIFHRDDETADRLNRRYLISLAAAGLATGAVFAVNLLLG